MNKGHNQRQFGLFEFEQAGVFVIILISSKHKDPIRQLVKFRGGKSTDILQVEGHILALKILQ